MPETAIVSISQHPWASCRDETPFVEFGYAKSKISWCDPTTCIA
jgi:hypothetical protein